MLGCLIIVRLASLKESVINSKLDFLLNNSNIGIYNKCEIIEIFGYKKQEKEAFNIYTLIVFENTNKDNTEKLLTDKPRHFVGFENISWGVNKRIVDISTVEKLYVELLGKNRYEIDKLLSVGDLKLLQAEFKS